MYFLLFSSSFGSSSVRYITLYLRQQCCYYFPCHSPPCVPTHEALAETAPYRQTLDYICNPLTVKRCSQFLIEKQLLLTPLTFQSKRIFNCRLPYDVYPDTLVSILNGIFMFFTKKGKNVIFLTIAYCMLSAMNDPECRTMTLVSL